MSSSLSTDAEIMLACAELNGAMLAASSPTSYAASPMFKDGSL